IYTCRPRSPGRGGDLRLRAPPAVYKNTLSPARRFVLLTGMALTGERLYYSASATTIDADAIPTRKVPTGIADLDSIVAGGFPGGSTVLLLGDIAAGMRRCIQH